MSCHWKENEQKKWAGARPGKKCRWLITTISWFTRKHFTIMQEWIDAEETNCLSKSQLQPQNLFK
jgi:hypothetical protein